jgi:spermidine/putrescine transport system permease protein
MIGRRNTLARAGLVYMAAVLLFLYVPIIVMVVMSFNASKLYRLPVDWSFTWYVALAGNDKLISAGLNSV